MYTFIWLGLMIFFVLVEASTVAMISIWFAVGALACVLLSLLGVGLWWQLVAFVLISGVLLGLLRPFAQKHFNNRTVRTNVESLVGKVGRVSEEINNELGRGRVRLDAMSWAARSTAGEVIPADAQIRVDRIEGVKVFVTRIPE